MKKSISSVMEKFIPTDDQCSEIKSIVENGENVKYSMQVSRSVIMCKLCLQQEEAVGDDFLGELTVCFLDGRYVIVERVLLNNRRKCTFTDVMKYIYGIVHATSVEVLEVQSVLTKQMRAWCLKYGFEPSYASIPDASDALAVDYVCNAQNNKKLEGTPNEAISHEHVNRVGLH